VGVDLLADKTGLDRVDLQQLEEACWAGGGGRGGAGWVGGSEKIGEELLVEGDCLDAVELYAEVD